MSTPLCRRDGCPRRIASKDRRLSLYCSAICSELDSEFDRLQSRASFTTSEGTTAWTALVDVADHWTEYLAARRTMLNTDIAKAPRESGASAVVASGS